MELAGVLLRVDVLVGGVPVSGVFHAATCYVGAETAGLDEREVDVPGGEEFLREGFGEAFDGEFGGAVDGECGEAVGVLDGGLSEVALFGRRMGKRRWVAIGIGRKGREAKMDVRTLAVRQWM